MQILFIAALLCARPADAVTPSAPAPKALRRAFLTASAASVAIATTTLHAAWAAPSFLDGVPREGGGERIDTMSAMNRAPNQPPSGPLAGTALGYRVGEAKVPFNDKIPARPPPGYIKESANTPVSSFLDGIPRETDRR